MKKAHVIENFKRLLSSKCAEAKNNGVNQGEFAKQLGITAPFLSDILLGKKTGERSIIEICEKAGIPLSELDSSYAPSNIEPGPEIKTTVPVISWVQAGNWAEVIDNFQPGDADEWIAVTSGISKQSFALRVVGDSMEPEFREGEIIVVDPERDAENGSYVVAKVNEHEATFKKIFIDLTGIYLIPINKEYGKINVTEMKWRIVGRVVEKVKKY